MNDNDNHKPIPPIPEHEQPNKEGDSSAHDSQDSTHEPLDDGLPNVSKNNSDLGKKLGKGMFVLLVIYLLYAVVLPDNDKKAAQPEKVAEKHNQIRPDYVAKIAVPAAPKPVEPKPTENTELQKMKLAYMEQQMKIYQVRQKAPIALWEGKQNVPASNANANYAASSQSFTNPNANMLTAQGRLPLTPAQIDALKKAQSGDSNTNFQERAEQSEVAQATATRIPYRDETVTQGTMISGVLQTAINSDLPGMVKANVSENVYGNTGQKLLIPKGSQLIGQYNSGIGLGQRRLFVMWTRLIRPDGVSVMLGSPGTDSLGTAGLDADVLQTHFWERFGQATFLSIISAGIANAGVSDDEEYNSASEYRMMMSQNFQQSANSSLASSMNQKPTIYIYQGDKIKVFVNRDLSFHAVEGSQEVR